MLTLRPVRGVPEGLAEKMVIVSHPPNELRIELSIPAWIHNYQQLGRYMWAHYHIHVEDEEVEDADEMGRMYYDDDLRSWIGCVEWLEHGKATIFLCPEYFVGWTTDRTRTDPNLPYTQEWQRLIENSRILGTNMLEGGKTK